MTPQFTLFFDTVSPFKSYGHGDPHELPASRMLRQVIQGMPVIQALWPVHANRHRDTVIVLRCDFATWSRFYRDPRGKNYRDRLLLIHRDGRVEFNSSAPLLKRIAARIQQNIETKPT